MTRTLTTAILFIVASYAVAAVPPGTDDEITARLQPFGSVCRTGDNCAGGDTIAAAGADGKGGKEVYDTFCFACHATGMSEAPKLGDVDAWAPRIAKGMEELLSTTIDGLNVMPPKGTCMACSDEELEAVVAYMIEESQ